MRYRIRPALFLKRLIQRIHIVGQYLQSLSAQLIIYKLIALGKVQQLLFPNIEFAYICVLKLQFPLSVGIVLCGKSYFILLNDVVIDRNFFYVVEFYRQRQISEAAAKTYIYRLKNSVGYMLLGYKSTRSAGLFEGGSLARRKHCGFYKYQFVFRFRVHCQDISRVLVYGKQKMLVGQENSCIGVFRYSYDKRI